MNICYVYLDEVIISVRREILVEQSSPHEIANERKIRLQFLFVIRRNLRTSRVSRRAS